MPLPLSTNNSKIGPTGQPILTRAQRTRRAFTLIELLLVTTLVVSLAAALVFSFTGLWHNAQLDEGAGRIESLVRFARAQAANTGRKVQLVFESENAGASNAPISEVKLTWEPDPLGHPGQFENLGEVAWQAQGICDLVQVANVQLRDHCKAHADQIPESSLSSERETKPESAESFSPITFYPDGTCDSAEITLASVGPEEEQRLSLRIVGITGAISRHSLGSDLSESDSENSRPTTAAPGDLKTK